ncbi:Ldh family oxidoreductase [bacterium]|nr:Ldh family oxidoreductase [bacterium]
MVDKLTKINMKIQLSELKEIVHKALLKYGYTEEESNVIGEVLLYAQMRGNNQGIVKLIGKGIPKSPEATEIKVLKERKASVLLDGGKNFGMVPMKKAIKMAIERAKEFGISIVGLTNTFSSTGAIGYFAREIAKADMVGMIYSGSPETVAPFGSYEPKFGTNPMAYGFPTTKAPVVFDMATSAMAWFGLVQAKTAGQSIPGDVAYDGEGNLTTDPAKAMEGAIRPFDKNYKGYGLNLVVELLTGPVIRSAVTGIKSELGWGNVVIAIDPSAFVDINEFKKDMDMVVERIHNAKTLGGVKKVQLPGEKGDDAMAKVLSTGEIEVEDNLLNELKILVKN